MSSLADREKFGKPPTNNTQHTRRDTLAGYRSASREYTPSEIASRVSWETLFLHLGVDFPGRHGRLACPLHAGGNTSSFSIDETRGLGFCFACGWGGDRISFVERFLNVDFRTALKLISGLAGIDLSRRRGPPDPAITRRRAERHALTAARERFKQWERWRLTILLREKQQSQLERELVTTIWSELHERPELYRVDEFLYWCGCLTDFYDKESVREYELDILVHREHEEARVALYQAEEETQK